MQNMGILLQFKDKNGKNKKVKKVLKNPLTNPEKFSIIDKRLGERATLGTVQSLIEN